MNSDIRLTSTSTVCTAHYCVTEDRNLLFSEQEIQAKTFMLLLEIILFVSALSYGRTYNKIILTTLHML